MTARPWAFQALALGLLVGGTALAAPTPTPEQARAILSGGVGQSEPETGADRQGVVEVEMKCHHIYKIAAVRPGVGGAQAAGMQRDSADALTVASLARRSLGEPWEGMDVAAAAAWGRRNAPGLTSLEGDPTKLGQALEVCETYKPLRAGVLRGYERFQQSPG